jgi:hypothetical protein
MYLALKGKANKPTNLGPNELSTSAFSLGANFIKMQKKENIFTIYFF